MTNSQIYVIRISPSFLQPFYNYQRSPGGGGGSTQFTYQLLLVMLQENLTGVTSFYGCDTQLKDGLDCILSRKILAQEIPPAIQPFMHYARPAPTYTHIPRALQSPVTIQRLKYYSHKQYHNGSHMLEHNLYC